MIERLRETARLPLAGTGQRERRGLTFVKARTDGAQGNQIHGSYLWTWEIPKMYMGTLGYKGNITL